MSVKIGDWVVIRMDAGMDPNHPAHKFWVEAVMRQFADQQCLYRVRDLASQGLVILENPYGHSKNFGRDHAEYFSWHEDWLYTASPVSSAQAVAKWGAVGDGTPGMQADEGKPQDDKPQKLTYSDRHEIIPQRPGESDKAYLRRILGGR